MTHPILRSLLSATALALVAASSSSALADGAAGHHHEESSVIGLPGEPSKVTRTVKVDMSDNMRFTPADVKVNQGETVRFVVRNVGQLKHEFVLGTPKALLEHYEQMKQNPEMEHADPNMVTLDPGKTGEVIWRFTKTGAVAIACLQPGHYDAGMKGSVKVAAAVHKHGKTSPK